MGFRPCSRSYAALLAALGLLATPVQLVVLAVLSLVELLAPAPAWGQGAEAVAKVAQAITVRIEGATQGSGVLVKREGNRYTLLTAWHVVSGQRPGEELAIFTSDGKQYQLEQGSIQRLGQVDLAVLSFSSAASYAVAQLGETRTVAMGNPIYLAGFPLASSAVPSRLLRFLDGRVVANATVAIPNGYQLLYSGQQPTLPGMSGGPVLNGSGQLVGIHGQSETEDRKTEQEGVFVKTGTSQAVPIGFYRQFVLGAPSPVATGAGSSADDYLAQAKQLLRQTGREQEVIRLTDLVVKQTQSADAYVYRGAAKFTLGDKQAAIADFNQALAINPQHPLAYGLRANAKAELGDKYGAIVDYSKALAINPRDYITYFSRGMVKYQLGDKLGGLADYNQSIALNSQQSFAFRWRGDAKAELGDNKGAVADYTQSLAINSQDALTYRRLADAKSKSGDKQAALKAYNQALAVEFQNWIAYNNRGNAKYKLGDKRGAILDYTQALAINPQGDSYLFKARADAKSDTGDKNGAIADYNQALIYNPEYIEAYISRGVAKSDLGDKQGAIADYNQVLAINPRNADAYNNRGVAKSDLGDKKGAIADYNQALDINPRYAEAYHNRGNDKYDLDDKQGACTDYRLAISLGNEATAEWIKTEEGAWCREMQ